VEVECLPADKPWDVGCGCGVCDTPELWLWRDGAAGLCARVRACAGAAESFTYIHTLLLTIYYYYYYKY